jgi:DNA repair photolyase
LPPPASSVEKRISAAATLKDTGMTVVITVSPLLPMLQPHSFFERLTKAADAVVIDHFIEGDGTRDGSRTLRTALPATMKLVNPKSV